MCEVGTVGKISDCHPRGPEFNPRPGQGLNIELFFFRYTVSVDRDVKPLVYSLDVLSGDLEEPTNSSTSVANAGVEVSNPLYMFRNHAWAAARGAL